MFCFLVGGPFIQDFVAVLVGTEYQSLIGGHLLVFLKFYELVEAVLVDDLLYLFKFRLSVASILWAFQFVVPALVLDQSSKILFEALATKCVLALLQEFNLCLLVIEVRVAYPAVKLLFLNNLFNLFNNGFRSAPRIFFIIRQTCIKILRLLT